MKEAEKALAAAQENLRSKKAEYAVVAGDADDEFWKSGGVMILINEDCRSHFGLSRMGMQIVKKTRSVNGLFSEMILTSFDAKSEVGKKLKRARTLSEKLFRFLESLRVVPENASLICFGKYYLRKTDKGWKKIA